MADAESNTKPRRKRRVIRNLLFGTAGIVMLAASAYGAWYGVSVWRLSAAVADARERGEPVWYADLQREPVDPADDGGPLLAAAAKKLVEPSEEFESWYSAVTSEPGKRVTVYGTGGRRIYAGPGNYPVFQEALEANAEALALLREAISKPHCRFPRTGDVYQPRPLLPALRRFSWLLRADLLHSLGTGRPQRAVAAMEELIGLSECLREEHSVVWQAMRIAFVLQALNDLPWILSNGELTDDQYAALDARMASLSARLRLQDAVMHERALSMTMLEALDERSDWLIYGRDTGALPKFFSRPRMINDQVLTLDLMRRVSENIDLGGSGGAEAFQDAIADDRATSRFFALTLPVLESLREGGLRYRQLLVNARLGMRVHRYRMQHGRFPAKLEEVLDARLSELPAGIFTSKPLVYRVSQFEFAIYAVGPNGKDDGGELRPDQTEYGTRFRVAYPAR